MGINVLIVDDSPLTQSQLSNIFTEAGCQIVDQVMDGTSAARVYKENKDKIDLVTLDITLPGKDGVEVLKEIMAFDPSAKVIMVSAMGKDQIIQECLQIGAKNFITKPFNKDKIRAVLSYVTK